MCRRRAREMLLSLDRLCAWFHNPVKNDLTLAPVRLKLRLRVSRGFRLHESVIDRSPYRR
ncbi:protein of unknown function [Paraburkholderia dioscoreae]|uniref:Uncharacterized protein n=1 Tax=Paraburkholderia dioscoreae TaxID=2604047 RepID=A0A5Q4ZB75_9BURK|nr:protein of unknown function [Paraburkholderia dioscoreae]